MFGGSFGFVQQYVELGRKTMIYTVWPINNVKKNNTDPLQEAENPWVSSTIQKIDSTTLVMISSTNLRVSIKCFTSLVVQTVWIGCNLTNIFTLQIGKFTVT